MFFLLVPYEGKLKTPIWHGVYSRCYILVKEEYTHHNPIVQFSLILHVLYLNILIKKSFIIFCHIFFFLPQT